MAKYALEFKKNGYMKYISHLDLLRLFKRTMRKCGLDLKYSSGFNPHPKIGFAQPLSLGYEGEREIIEFELVGEENSDHVPEVLAEAMPDGIYVGKCIKIADDCKALAALVRESYYEICFPDAVCFHDGLKGYMNQESIIAEKKSKKTGKVKQSDIRGKIKELKLENEDRPNVVFARLDAGSQSNLSPEAVITTLKQYYGMDVDRHEIAVKRLYIRFEKDIF